jgi:hypothetical protein
VAGGTTLPHTPPSADGSIPSPSASLHLVRLGTEKDWNFIIPSWGEGVWNGCGVRQTSDISFAVFRTLFTDVQKRLLEKSTVYVSTLPDAPDVVIGYAVVDHGDPTQLHWATVKRGFQGLGIMRDILAAAGIGKRNRIAYTFKANGIRYPRQWIHVPHWLSERV